MTKGFLFTSYFELQSSELGGSETLDRHRLDTQRNRTRDFTGNLDMIFNIISSGRCSPAMSRPPPVQRNDDAFCGYTILKGNRELTKQNCR